MRIAWRTVGAIIERVLPRHRSVDPLDGLTQIGVDELSYRRHHEYVTVIVDHVRGGVVWASPGKNAETLNAFFEELGNERCAQLEAVTLDMSGAYLKSVTEASPQARVIFDRFHVQRQYVLSFPYELSALAAIRPHVLTALSRIFWQALRLRYRRSAKGAGYSSSEAASRCHRAVPRCAHRAATSAPARAQAHLTLTL